MLYKTQINIIRETKDKREMREYSANFSRLLFFFMFSKIEKDKTPLIDKR